MSVPQLLISEVTAFPDPLVHPEDGDSVLLRNVSNSRAIARQLLAKRFPAATDTHAMVEVLFDCNIGNGVLCVVRAEMLLAGSVEFRRELSAVC
jgi:hypothetical protein